MKTLFQRINLTIEVKSILHFFIICPGGCLRDGREGSIEIKFLTCDITRQLFCYSALVSSIVEVHLRELKCM